MEIELLLLVYVSQENKRENEWREEKRILLIYF